MTPGGTTTHGGIIHGITTLAILTLVITVTMVRIKRLIQTLPLVLLLAACASGPGYDTRQVSLGTTPRSAVDELEAVRGQKVLWGGVILNTSNMASVTRLEILAYPLDGKQSPQRDREPLGRFLLEHQGFLEPATYAEGRLITMVGTVVSSARGQVGELDYIYPVIEASELHLWPRDSDYTTPSNVHFGIGIGIGL